LNIGLGVCWVCAVFGGLGPGCNGVGARGWPFLCGVVGFWGQERSVCLRCFVGLSVGCVCCGSAVFVGGFCSVLGLLFLVVFVAFLWLSELFLGVLLFL
jgi:hypothetical protein